MQNFNILILLKKAIDEIYNKGLWLSDFDKNREQNDSLAYCSPHKLDFSEDEIEDLACWYDDIINMVNIDKQLDITIEILLFIEDLKKKNVMLNFSAQTNEKLKKRERNQKKETLLRAVDTILNSMKGEKQTKYQRALIILLKYFKRQVKRLYYIQKDINDNKGILTDTVFNIKSHDILFKNRNKEHLKDFLKKLERKYKIKIRQHSFKFAIQNTSI